MSSSALSHQTETDSANTEDKSSEVTTSDGTTTAPESLTGSALTADKTFAYQSNSPQSQSITNLEDESTKRSGSEMFVSESSEMDSVKSPVKSITPVILESVLDKDWFHGEKLKIEEKLQAVQRLKKRRLRDEKAAAAKLERMLPMDLLAFDWFNENKLTSELRVYLIDKLLPTLILGMEKVLVEADKKGLIEGEEFEENVKFNPVNLLAQYLMRNNPLYSNFPEASPYVRGLRKVSEELKHHVFESEANKLAKLKLEAKLKREELENIERQKEEDKLKRKQLLEHQFLRWLVESGRLQLQLIQNSLYSYLEISSHLASDTDNVIHYSKELDPTDETGKTLTVEEYIEYVEGYVQEMTMTEFKHLIHHLDQCALAYRRTFEREVWREMFTQLFTSLDSESSGYLDRHRMLHLLEKFWDKLQDTDKATLHNPRKWPVIELEELDDLFPDSEDESDQDLMLSTEELSSSDLASALKYENSEDVKESIGKDGEIDGQEEAKSESKEINVFPPEDEQLSEKVSSSAGEDVVIAYPKNETSPPKIVVVEEEKGFQKEGSDEGKDEEVVTNVDEEKRSITESPEDTGKSQVVSTVVDEKEAEDNVYEKTNDDLAGEVASSSQEEVVALPQEKVAALAQKEVSASAQEEVVASSQEEISASSQEEAVASSQEEVAASSQEEIAVLSQEEVAISSQEKVAASSQEKVAASSPEEDIKEDIPSTTADGMRNLLSSTGLTATLVTPAPSIDGNVDVGPVNIQFSKEPPQTQVRKTTTITTIQRKSKDSRHQEEIAETDPRKLAEVHDIGKLTKQEQKLHEAESETILTVFAPESENILVQHTVADMHVEDYLPVPVEVKTRPASTGRMSVTFAAESLIVMERNSADFFSLYSSRSQSRMTSVFDENQLNEGRFVSLLENFLCDDTIHQLVDSMVTFINEGYVETEEEKISRLERARREVLSAKHKQMVDNLFNKWDNDGQGYLNNEEIDDVLSKYKGGMEASALKRGRQAVRQTRKNAPYHDRRRLNRKEFHVYINAVCSAMIGGEEVFDGLVEYATSTVERTYAERVRGDARRKWLQQIQSAAETGGASMEPVYRSLFQAFYKDADAHGNQKRISAYIALLEHNSLYPHRGPVLLRYVACTPDNSPFLLGKAFYEDMNGISFYAVRRGKLVHVPRVQSHGRIYFWNPDHKDAEKEGSLVLVPLRDARRRTYGLIGIDNVDIAASADRSIFSSHEINFFQGVAKTFSNAFHHVDLRRKLLRIVDAAMSWIHSRAPRVRTITIYFVEPDPKSNVGYVLRKMMTADNNTGVTITHTRPLRLYRKDNLFRDYLFKCMENSETTSADAYGEHHTAYPLRDGEGRCQSIVDISMGKLGALPRHENREVQRMLKLLQAANREVMRESESGEKTVVLEAEEKASDDTRVDIMFDRLMLTDLRENVSKLDNNLFAELKNYKIPPPMIHNIIKAVLLLFHSNLEEEIDLEDWTTCKQLVTGRLRQRILSYDPTAETENQQSEEETEEMVITVGRLLKGIAHGAVARQGSRPAQQLYNWAFVCLSLIEHARKMRKNDGQPAVTPITSASTNTTVESCVEQPGSEAN